MPRKGDRVHLRILARRDTVSVAQIEEQTYRARPQHHDGALPTQTKENVAKALTSIRSGANPVQVMEALNSCESSREVLHTVLNAQNGWITSHDQRPGPSSDQSHLQAEASGSKRGTETNLSSRDSSAFQWPVNKAILQPSNTIAALDGGVKAFFSCTGYIFYIYDQGEAQELLNAIKPCIRNAGENWPQLVFRNSAPVHLKVSLCSVSIVAAIGLQYTKEPIPALGFESSAENGTHQYITIFYEFAKHLLEAAIENDIIEAIKVCAAMCVFNTIRHATFALANADMGINFALNLGPGFQHCPIGLSKATWVNYKRVARTLLTLRSWLVSTLGYAPGNNPDFREVIHWLIDQGEIAPDEVIQQELAKVVHIEANLLRTIDSFRDISPPIFGSIRRDLAQWYEQLPQWMHLDALVESSELARGTRRTVFLVHLFYLSAKILVARLAHNVKSSSLPRYDIEEMRNAAGDGVLAARTASRILQLQLDERAIFQRCWLCEFTAYTSCLMLLHSAAQLLLYDYPQPVWQKELSYAKYCLNVLEYCGNVDKVALRFAEVTRGYHNTLIAQAPQDRDLPAIDMLEKFDHLFAIPESSSSHLNQLSRDLLKLISCPFGYPPNLHTEGMLKAGFGTQPDWNSFVTMPFNRSLPKAANGLPLLEMALSGMRSGRPVKDNKPKRGND